MLERDFQQAVLTLARIGGWRVAHFRPAQTGKGWRTPVSADGAGFPDLVLVSPRGVLYRELKTDTTKPRPDQVAWGTALTDAGADWAVWWPRDLAAIAEQLTGRPVRRTTAA